MSETISARRNAVHRWLLSSLDAIDPRRLTETALSGSKGPVQVIAIGKAAAAMCWGAADALGRISGLCITNAPAPLPRDVELIVADHPVPGSASFEAGRRVLEFASTVEGRCLALISGGGSALCERPLDGITPEYLQKISRALLKAGASIDDTNLVRRQLSAIKRGGLARAVPGRLETYLISDVAASNPAIIASGPTIPATPDPNGAREVLERYGIELPAAVWEAMNREQSLAVEAGPVAVIADGRIAGQAVVDAAAADGFEAVLEDGWIGGSVDAAMDRLFGSSRGQILVAAGEPDVEVKGDGSGGRNSHAALMAAQRIAGTDAVFAAFATDGVDGTSDAAGAVVDGRTTERGGDPGWAIQNSDSAAYLLATGDLIETGPTGTNVSDLWVLWRG